MYYYSSETLQGVQNTPIRAERSCSCLETVETRKTDFTERATMSENDSDSPDDVTCPVVIDIGAGFIRAGFSEDDMYRAHTVSIVGISFVFSIIVYSQTGSPTNTIDWKASSSHCYDRDVAKGILLWI